MIRDKHSRHTPVADQRLLDRRNEYLAQGGSNAEIQEFGLFDSHAQIVDFVDDFIDRSNGNVIVDITSLPKRFFFPIVRRLLLGSAAGKVSNLVATYTLPRTYPRGVALAENFNDWAHLPLFGGDYLARSPDMLVIGVGFQALGLHEQLKGEEGLPTKLLLPFPAAPEAFQRSWELLRQLRKDCREELIEVHRTAAFDAGDTFDRLLSLTRNGTLRADLAPFGPKPMSLGMCIFASLTNSQVFYTQPSDYYPDYSIDIAQLNGVPDVRAFAIRINDRDYFSVT